MTKNKVKGNVLCGVGGFLMPLAFIDKSIPTALVAIALFVFGMLVTRRMK